MSKALRRSGRLMHRRAMPGSGRSIRTRLIGFSV
jgi:hypothetical protein